MRTFLKGRPPCKHPLGCEQLGSIWIAISNNGTGRSKQLSLYAPCWGSSNASPSQRGSITWMSRELSFDVSMRGTLLLMSEQMTNHRPSQEGTRCFFLGESLDGNLTASSHYLEACVLESWLTIFVLNFITRALKFQYQPQLVTDKSREL